MMFKQLLNQSSKIHCFKRQQLVALSSRTTGLNCHGQRRSFATKDNHNSNANVIRAIPRQQLEAEVADKVLSDQALGNLSKFRRAYDWHLSETMELINSDTPYQRKLDKNNVQPGYLERVEEFATEWAMTLWPEKITPEAIHEYRTLQAAAQLDLTEEEVDALSPPQRKEALQARSELRDRDERREQNLVDNRHAEELIAYVQDVISEDYSGEHSLELARDDDPARKIYNDFFGYFDPDCYEHERGAILETRVSETETEEEQQTVLVARDLSHYRVHPDAEVSLAYLRQLDKLDPVTLKEPHYMTAADRKQSDAFKRTIERRIESIKNKCNFHEVYRNRDLFDDLDFNKLIARSLAKTPNNELPAEFLVFAQKLKNYETANPGKYAIALKFGRDLPAANQADLMSKEDYNAILGEDGAQDWSVEDLILGQMPKELKEAMQKYSQRVIKEYVQSNEKVDQLLTFLAESSKKLSKADIDALVARIIELDDKPKTIKDQEVASLMSKDGNQAARRFIRFDDSATLENAADVIKNYQSQVLKKHVKKLSKSEFEQHHKLAKAYLSKKDSGFAQLCQQLSLDDSQAFAALITDIFVNTSGQNSAGEPHCLLLDRFVSLLSQLSGNPAHSDASVYELIQTYDGDSGLQERLKSAASSAQSSANLDDLIGLEKRHVYQRLASDPSFMLKFTILQIAKQHNLYGQVDNYMRSFAKICTELPDRGVIAKKLEGLLNTEIAILDARRARAFEGTDQSSAVESQDYQTVHPNILAQPDFQFLPAGMKIARIEEYERMQKELRKTRHIREMLQDADKHGSHVQRRLMNSPSALDKIIDHIDADPLTSKEHGKLRNLWYLERQKKIAGSVDDLVGKILGEGFGVSGISWDNIEQVYNPLVSGVYSISEQKQRLISAGMSASLADELSKLYLSKLGRQSQMYSLMDFFSNERAKRALHDPNLDMASICLNYEVQRPVLGREQPLTLSQGLRAQVQQISQSVRPVRPMIRSAARGFSTFWNRDGDHDDGSDKKSGKFFKFIENAEKMDEEIQKNPELAKQVSKKSSNQDDEEQVMMFDADEIEIQLGDSVTGKNGEDQTLDNEVDAAEPEQFKESLSVLQQKQFAKIAEAKEKFNTRYFMSLAHFGPGSNILTQEALERKFAELSSEDKELMILSMLNSAYELNEFIPNIEMMFFKMFVSPVSTKQLRKQQDKDDLLVGNIFHDQESFKMPKQAYISLLQSVSIQPKKKHYKKIIQFMVLNESANELSSDLIDMLTFIGIDQKYPVLLGSTMKFLLQNNYKVSKQTFQRFVMFLERCKGYEEDAKRFVFLTNETEVRQMDYEMVRPLFQRTIEYKTPQEVLKLFEQIRKNLKLNKSSKKLDTKAQNTALASLRKDFYDGLIRDLLAKKAFQLSQIIYGEKNREKFEQNVNDQLMGLEIYSAQAKIDDYREVFQEFSREDSKFRLTEYICEQIGRTLLKFKSDEHQKQMLEMCDSLRYKIFEKKIPMSSRLFDSLVTQYTETQSWSKVSELLNNCDYENCDPNQRIVSYMKKNLVYCFDTTIRAQLKEGIEEFEQKFFSIAGQEMRRQHNENKKTRKQLRENQARLNDSQQSADADQGADQAEQAPGVDVTVPEEQTQQQQVAM